MPTPADTPPRRRRRRLWIVLAVLAALVLGVRAALPELLRSVLEEQGTAFLHGRLSVEDVDLGLLRGAVSIRGATLQAEDAAADDPPLVSFERFWVDIDWLALAGRLVDIEDVGIAGLAMHVDRLADGELVLPALRESGEEKPEDAEEEEESKPWGVVIRRLTLEDAGLQLQDHVAEPSVTRRLSLPALRFADFRLQPDPDAAPGYGRVRLELDDGVLELRSRVRTVASGFELTLALEATDVPIERLHVHLPSLGWRKSTGRLNGLVTARVTPETPLVARGGVSLDDLAVEVPGEEGAALAWRSLAVEAEEIDLAARSARIASVALDGGRVLVRPDAPVPLPVLPGGGGRARAPSTPPSTAGVKPAPPAAVEAEEAQPEEGGGDAAVGEEEERALEEEEAEAEEGAEPATVEPEESTGAAEPDEPAGDASVDEKAPPAKTSASEPAKKPDAPSGEAPPWTWSVGTVAVKDTVVKVFFDSEPLDVRVRSASAKKLSSARGVEATVHAEIDVADGSLVLDGPVVLDPLGLALSVQATDLDLGRLVALARVAPAPVVARLDAELDVTARDDPLVVRGRAELRDVETKLDDGDEFLVAWKRLALGIERVAVPGLLPFGGGSGLGDVAVVIATVELDEPRVVTTLGPDGLVLPGGDEEEEEEAAAASPEATGDQGGGVSVVVNRLTVRNGDVRFTDTTVTPAYRGRLARLAVDARGLRIPENRVDRVTLTSRVGGKAPLEVTSVRRGDAVQVTSTLRDVPLSQFNPYATAYGYRIGSGKLNLDSDTTVRGDAYDSENRIGLDRFAVGGGEGDNLFQKTFGVPLGVTLALLRDLDGRISLGVPVKGDRQGGGVKIGSVVREALVRAIVGALASPLKLLGAAVPLGKNKATVEVVEPAPIAFVPGTTRISRGSREQAAQLATGLGRLPALRIRIAGRAGPKDARALAERSVLADLEEGGGVLEGVRGLFGGGTRGEVRDALRKRAEGKRAPLDGEAAEQLDAWVAEQSVEHAVLLALATERAMTLQRQLLDGGARPEQILVDPPKAKRKTGISEVHVQVAEDPLPLEGVE